jgi:uncharacterized YccA/Bax inhibitor family protein
MSVRARLRALDRRGAKPVNSALGVVFGVLPVALLVLSAVLRTWGLFVILLVLYGIGAIRRVRRKR